MPPYVQWSNRIQGPHPPCRPRDRHRALRAGAMLCLLAGAMLLVAGPGLRAETGEQPQGDEAENGPAPAMLIEIDGAIGPATTHHVRRGIAEAGQRDVSVLIVRMNTPGGLDSSTREIVQAILGSPVPVIVYVAPSGARATSAGTYILFASHLAGMAPGTTVGAATPIRMGASVQDADPLTDRVPQPMRDRVAEFRGVEQAQTQQEQDAAADEDDPDAADDAADPQRPDPRDAMERKIIEDSVAYLRGLAELRGRNKDWAERAVREGVSLAYNEALEMGVIEIIAGDVQSLLQQADGMAVQLDERETTLRTAGAAVEVFHADWRTQLLAVLANPNTAFILMMLGIYGLILEFSNPGAIYPGVIGAICLLLALFALGMLPLNWAAMGLLLLGIALMVGEAFTPTFGILGVGGVIAFILGALMLFDTDVPAFQLGWPVVIVATAFSVGVFIFLVSMLWQSQRRAVVSGREQLIGAVGQVLAWDPQARRGRIRVLGELWNAESDDPIEPDTQVRITAAPSLTLRVQPVKTRDEEAATPGGTDTPQPPQPPSKGRQS